MPTLTSMGVRDKLWGLVIIFALGFAGFGVAVFGALQSVQVGGTYYKRVLQGKDLIADVMPPPLYISESYQVMLRMAGEMDAARLRVLIDKSRVLEEDFKARRAYWLSTVTDSTIRQELQGPCTRPAVEFYEVLDRMYIPALLRGNREAAFEIARGVLTEKYEGQRGAVQTLVSKLTAQQEATEEEVQAVVVRRTRFLMLFAAAILALAGGCCWLLARSIVGPLGRTAEVLGLVATGDLSRSVDSDSSDEIGRMARALNETLAGMRAALGAEHVNWAEVGHQRAEVNRIRQLVENARINITCADRELALVYLNPSARATFERLSAYLPVAADALQGQSLTRLHPSLAGVRERLKDPAQLPLELRIEIGPESLELSATAIHDEQGRFVGPMVTWEVVTARLAAERTAREAQEQALRVAEERRQAEATEATRRQEESQVREREQQSRVESERAQAAELRTRVDQILAVVSAAAEGDLTRDVLVEGDDAVGRLADGLRRLLGDLRDRIRGIARTATALGVASEQLSSTATGIRQAVGNVSAEAGVVAKATAEVSDHVQTVAAGTEEMNASILDISKSTATAAGVAGRAVEVAARTNHTVTKLGESSAEIGKVIKVITSIAQQTNLLALNATIEAARAGEAGKGFAVVANEVKELAKETARATEEIGGKIEAIQADTGDAVTAIREISEIIAQINGIQTSVAGAVEEQTATTNEMSRNVAEAASGSGEIVRSIAQMARTAEAAAAGANQGQEAAHDLARMASELQGLIDRFRLEVVERPAARSDRRVVVRA